MAGGRRVGQPVAMSRLTRSLAAAALALTLLSGLTPAAGVAPGTAAPVASALTPGGWLRFPGLGASGSEEMIGTVLNWGCRGGLIGPRIYRWGCAATGNRYLMAHADAAFSELHDFVRARGAVAGTRALVGRHVYFKTTGGETLVYRVTWARVATVDYWGRTGHVWAWGPTERPAITFQTCYGSRSEYRLIVRAELVG